MQSAADTPRATWGRGTAVAAEHNTMSETIDVTDGDVTESAEITETYDHRGDTFAKVEGEQLSGYVQVN